MAKLSIIIPSRDERFLVPTIDDIFRNARGECEVVVVIDSNLWPDNWKEVVTRHSPRLHTIFHGEPLGMRRAINDGVASAISRGAKFIAKFDAHCSFSEGFDEVLKAECEPNWIVVPRRGRLDPESWTVAEPHKPDIDYHYLSFPDDPNDFGGPGLNGKVWGERAVERKDILLDDEMSSQGSGWFMHADYFQQLGLMDEASYGPFWNEFQELGMKAWLSGGAVKVNKKCRYLHLHKGSKHGRGYRLNESWLKLGRDHTMKWIWNEAWDERQVRPFSWLIEHFWPVPTWPENWEEALYATRKPRVVAAPVLRDGVNLLAQQDSDKYQLPKESPPAASYEFIKDVQHEPAAQMAGHRKGEVLTIGDDISVIDKGRRVSLRTGHGTSDDFLIGEEVRPIETGSRADTQWERGQVLRQSGLSGEEAAMLVGQQDLAEGKGVTVINDLTFSKPEKATYQLPEQQSDWPWVDAGDGEKLPIAPLMDHPDMQGKLVIHSARYGILGSMPPFADHSIDVTERVRSLVKDGSLDIIVNNSTLTPGQNPFRGKKKVLLVNYSINGSDSLTSERVEKDWLIIGVPTQRDIRVPSRSLEAVEAPIITESNSSAIALNDFLRRKFNIDDRRLRAPMPIELRDFHRDNLAQLFAELGFKRGAEIGVAEGHYSETLCKAIPDLELLCVDPWQRYSGNPRAHSKAHQEFSLNETKRKLAPYNAKLIQDFSMNAVRDVADDSLDFCYIDGHHGFDYCMEDLISWSKKVRTGGIVAGDDYYHFKWAGVVEAVQAYVNAHRIPIWYVFQGHKSVDFFWCKP